MAATTPIFAAISAVTAIGGGVAAHRATQAQNRAQKRTFQAEQRLAEIENVRRARRTIAEGRIQRAQLLAAGENAGLERSSSPLGAAGSVLSGAASNIGAAASFAAARDVQARRLATGANQYAKSGTIASTLGAISSVSADIGALYAAGNFEWNPFKKKTPPNVRSGPFNVHGF